MKDTTSPIEAYRPSQLEEGRAIEAALLSLAYDLIEYADRTSPRLVIILAGHPHIEARHASPSPELRSALHSIDDSHLNGLSRRPSLTKTYRPQTPPSSHHEEVRILVLKQAIEQHFIDLHRAICVIPILGHDDLQISISVYSSKMDDPPVIRVWVDGISLYHTPSTPGSIATAVARNFSSLRKLKENPDDPWPQEWPFFVLHNHLVRAPGPGWAWLKLLALIQGRPITDTDVQDFLKTPPPQINKLMPKECILEGIFHLNSP